MDFRSNNFNFTERELCEVLFFSAAEHPKSGLDRLIVHVSRSHTIRHTNTNTNTNTHTHTHTLRLFWTSDRLVTGNATYTTQNKHRIRTSMPSAGYEFSIPAIERPHDYALDLTATRIGWDEIRIHNFSRKSWKEQDCLGEVMVKRSVNEYGVKVPAECTIRQ
jgi:hypothetical protein